MTLMWWANLASEKAILDRYDEAMGPGDCHVSGYIHHVGVVYEE